MSAAEVKTRYQKIGIKPEVDLLLKVDEPEDALELLD